jgi:type I restriction enzyme S subunit
MNGKQLKNSILQWAIQGKLVPQDPNDEPASVLLEKIRQEKERLIKEKKIKRDKNASIIYRGEDNSYYEKFLATGEVKCIDAEIPFEIPQGWEWERWGNISQSIQYGYNAPALEHGAIKMVRISDIQENCVLWDNVPYCQIEENDIDTYLLKVNDILFARTGGTVGKSFLVEEVPERAIYAGYLIRTRYSSLLNPRYMKLFMESQLYWEQLKNGTIATAQPNCNGKTLAKMLLPIPPTKEQDRIVGKLTQLSSFLNNYTLCQERLNLLNEEIKEQLKKSILQEAIQGKLVPQIAEEGTAQELLEQIKAEKQKLVKEGKLKKSALTTSTIFRGDDNKYYEQVGEHCEDITEEIPFELPASWNWTRGKIVFMPMESTKPTSDFIYIDVDAVNNKLNIIDNPKKISIDNVPSRATRKLHQNDILFSVVRPYLRNIALVDDTYKSAIASTGFYVITPGVGYFPKFLFYLMLSNYVVDGLNTFMKGDNSPSINNSHIENYLYPLPPFKEQQRIVAQIERLFEQLK